MRYYKLEDEVRNLFKEINTLTKNPDNALYLGENTYFLNNSRILCLPRKNGVSRFPYGKDGFTAWVYSSGYISVNESTFYLFLPSEEGKEPYMAFFAGEKRKDNTYSRISLLGGASNLEEKDVKRYVVYEKTCAYFLVETKNNQYGVRIYVTDEKKVVISLVALHNKNKECEFYLSSFMNALFKYCDRETMETKWFKKCTYENDHFLFESHEDLDRTTHVLNFGVIQRCLQNNAITIHNTTSRSIYAGGKENSIAVSTSLLNGRFEQEKTVTHFTDTAALGDIVHYHFKGKDITREDYFIDFCHDTNTYNKLINFDNSKFPTDEYLNNLRKQLIKKENSSNMLKFSFENWNNEKINDKTLNLFLNFVQYQTEYCGLAKNSGALFLGVRDVMQQIDAALMWNPKDCRKKILEVLDYIDPSGNPPRQYSIPPKGAIPRMDLRPFIDQGVWIVSTIYNYLSYTNDYSILKEKVGYYERQKEGGVLRSKIVDTVLNHLIRIMDYLVTHIDENTNCLRAMYGDWNDALDGLGVSKKGLDYGNGVSVMATLQLYRNLEEMIDLLEKINQHPELIELYKKTHANIIEGIKTHAIKSQNNQRKILHGWGEDQSYEVGGFNDVDNLSRDSLTANAFYIISGMNQHNLLSNDDILNAYRNLDSKYGLRTFAPHFEPGVKGVGRIVNLPKGTAENGATYIHATLFGVLSLFKINEGEKAFEQLEKVLPLTHSILSTTPFVMPNSYSYNTDSMMDGESMSDWYTGSANTLIKVLVRGLFGINPTLDGVILDPSNYFRSKHASLSLKVKQSLLNIEFNGDKNVSIIEIDGVKYPYKKKMFINNDYLNNHKNINIKLY